jgi:hypothetical protein
MLFNVREESRVLCRHGLGRQLPIIWTLRQNHLNAAEIRKRVKRIILERPSLENLMDFFNAYPQGDERAHLHIKIDAFSPQHRLLAKIILHNLWPIARRSELVLKRARFFYALVMRMSFCLCKHIMHTMLEMRDKHSAGLPFACLVTKICLQVVTESLI